MPLGVSVLLVVLVATGAFALVRKRVDGRVRTTSPTSVSAAAPVAPAREVLTAAEIGAELGSGATLVQVSSAFCAPCRAARVLLTKVADARDDVAYADVDAESHLDLVRRLDIRRTPTVLVLDSAGAVVARASGVPKMPEIEAVLTSVIRSRISDVG
ncbi:thioredoxin family protein [Mumia sp. ZJ1417]|uniref:thioredoxin family protein n=1 Tax=Mumia sp. ZJ1417 TaxID=2708082 RepID=UPI00141EF6F4|nr:thioredoxin family protein [Mumia sp. ZJ1417]QMW66865.1 thioredoxin family protein [Mumia sp. ZJ1417]